MGNGRPPALATWAEVDPARHPFDPAGVPAVVRTMALPPPRREPEDWPWVDAVGAALSERYGPWAYCWHWTPGESDRLGRVTRRVPPPAEVPAFVADSLLAWRRWLEDLAELFDRLLPLPDPARSAGPGGVATWEAAVAQVVRTVIAPVVDGDGWQGWCRRVLQWFLTAAAVPADSAAALVDGAIEKWFDDWVIPTTAIVDDVAERLARDAFGLGGTATPQRLRYVAGAAQVIERDHLGRL